MHRFFVPHATRDELSVVIAGDVAHQIARVLRLRAHEEIVLIPTDADNAVEWRVRLVSVEARAVRGEIIAERPALPEPTCALTLCAALLKGERFDWLLQKATELGVATIQPIVTAHTIRKIGRDDGHLLDRWRRIVTEAAEQSGRGRVPAICGPAPLGDLLNTVAAPIFVAHETVEARTLAETVPAEAAYAAIAIGPEGGFSESEVARLRHEAGAIPVSLGPRVLRAETAAITAVTVVMTTTGNLAPPRERAWSVASHSGHIGAA